MREYFKSDKKKREEQKRKKKEEKRNKRMLAKTSEGSEAPTDPAVDAPENAPAPQE